MQENRSAERYSEFEAPQASGGETSMAMMKASSPPNPNARVTRSTARKYS